jgi:type IV pilus assembly protein PilP
VIVTNALIQRALSTATPRRLLLVALALVLAGCGRAGTADLEAYIDEVRSRPGGQIDPIPEVKPYEAFVYQAFEMRDPFSMASPGDQAAAAAARAASSGSGVVPDFKRPRELTEEFPLDAVRMVGHVRLTGQLWALIQDPNGTLHRVRPGNYIGKNHGRIIRVAESQIDLTEIVPDGLGGWMERQTALVLGEI